MIILGQIGDYELSSILEDYITPYDYPVFIIYLIIIILTLFNIKHKKEELNPAYKYFVSGFLVKIIAGIIFTLIYLFYYSGGDCINYFWSTRALSKLLLVNPGAALDIIINDNRTIENSSWFNNFTKSPIWRFYFGKAVDSIGVVRLSSVFMTLGFNLWLPCLVVINLFWYRGIWKFYLLVCKFYPGNIKWNAICVLFVPSVLFWGSGIMKDSFTFAATLWLVTNMYYCFIERKNFFSNLLMLIVNSYIILILKPYIFVAIIPPSLIWISYLSIKKIKNTALKLISAPLLIAVGIGMGLLVLSMFKSSLGDYGTSDTIIAKVKLTQQDLMRGEEYGQNYYNIGEYDASITGALSKAPIAIISGLFRPFIWEARNIVMLISGLENTFLLFFTLYMIFRIGVKAIFSIMIREPMIIFALIFALIFSYSVGMASANFGALVRYRILALPFFMIALTNTYYLIQKNKKEISDTFENPNN